MTISAILHEETPSGAPMLGDHLAMDLLNTEARNDGKAIEFWNSDAEVLQWLARYDITPASEGKTLTPGELLTQAKALRALARRLITEFKDGKSPEIGELNQYLQAFYFSISIKFSSNISLVSYQFAVQKPSKNDSDL